VTVPESKQYSLFIFQRHITISVAVIENEGKRG
jgi:hypothetical protein